MSKRWSSCQDCFDVTPPPPPLRSRKRGLTSLCQSSSSGAVVGERGERIRLVRDSRAALYSRDAGCQGYAGFWPPSFQALAGENFGMYLRRQERVSWSNSTRSQWMSSRGIFDSGHGQAQQQSHRRQLVFDTDSSAVTGTVIFTGSSWCSPCAHADPGCTEDVVLPPSRGRLLGLCDRVRGGRGELLFKQPESFPISLAADGCRFGTTSVLTHVVDRSKATLAAVPTAIDRHGNAYE